MSKKKNRKNEPHLYVIETTDRMDWDYSHTTEPMSEAKAEAKFNALTENGSKNTRKNRMAFTIYEMRRLSLYEVKRLLPDEKPD